MSSSTDRRWRPMRSSNARAPRSACSSRRASATCCCSSGTTRTRSTTFDYAKPEPVVRRRDVVEIDERIAADGTVIRSPDRAAVTSLIRRVLAEGSYEAAALCFLHAYANPDHERMVAGVIRELAPSLPVTCSNEVTREFREYERASTTALAAYVQPVMAGYVNRFSAALGRRGFAGRFSIMQSNGGTDAGRSDGAKRHLGPLLGPRGGRRSARYGASPTRDTTTSSPSTWAAPAPMSRSLPTANPSWRR